MDTQNKLGAEGGRAHDRDKELPGICAALLQALLRERQLRPGVVRFARREVIHQARPGGRVDVIVPARGHGSTVTGSPRSRRRPVRPPREGGARPRGWLLRHHKAAELPG